MTRREFLAAPAALPALVATAAPIDPFSGVPSGTRLRMHWWVFGTAWTKDEAERQLQLMAEAHIGSVLIFPAHPYEVDDPARGVHNQQYLSPEFFEVLNTVVAKARQLALVLDIVAGTGWPFGGPTVTAEEAARMIQCVRIQPLRIQSSRGTNIQLPRLGAGETRHRLIPRSSGRLPAPAATLGRFSLDDVTPGSEVQFFYSKVTGQQVKRASAGAEGHVLDHFSSDAVEHYLDQVGSKLLKGTPPSSFRSFFCDSFEVYRANWTPRFPDEFQRRRGYDILERLPALFNSTHADTADLRHDF